MVTVGATGRLFRNAGMSARGTRQNRRKKGNQAAIAGKRALGDPRQSGAPQGLHQGAYSPLRLFVVRTTGSDRAILLNRLS
jgi:hypothetical protein